MSGKDEKRKAIFSPQARADIRAIDRETALRLLKALARFLETNAGDVRRLEGFDAPLYRLRVGDWRCIFRSAERDSIEVLRVRNRSEAYR
jgi:mRNA-degrading endonuclease RelE of RelBE toxin-antitoxin system